MMKSAKSRREPSPNAGGEERRKSPKGFKNIITVLGVLELKAAGLVVSAHGGQRKSVAQTVAA